MGLQAYTSPPAADSNGRRDQADMVLAPEDSRGPGHPCCSGAGSWCPHPSPSRVGSGCVASDRRLWSLDGCGQGQEAGKALLHPPGEAVNIQKLKRRLQESVKLQTVCSSAAALTSMRGVGPEPQEPGPQEPALSPGGFCSPRTAC